MTDTTAFADEGGDKRDYEVGYGKPPRAHRFKPGQSGNPGGRRKGEPNMKTFQEKELSRKQWVTVDGKRRRLSNRQMAVIAQIHKARKGDTKAFLALMAQDEALRRETEVEAQRQDLSPEERAQLQRHLAYVKKRSLERGDDV